MIKYTAKQLYNNLVSEYGIIGQKGRIIFTLKGLSVKINTRDTVGNLIQEWLREWMELQEIEFEINPNTQRFPDVYLNLNDKKKGLLEIKAFDYNRGAGFDLANFESYSKSLLEDSYRLDSDYLILGYTMEDGEITIANVWLKKIWELSGGSGTYPLKVQEKKKVIYNIRPINWYSKRSRFKCFNSKEEFLNALNETRYQYSKTRFENSHWLRNVLKDYKKHTGLTLEV